MNEGNPAPPAVKIAPIGNAASRRVPSSVLDFRRSLGERRTTPLHFQYELSPATTGDAGKEISALREDNATMLRQLTRSQAEARGLQDQLRRAEEEKSRLLAELEALRVQNLQYATRAREALRAARNANEELEISKKGLQDERARNTSAIASITRLKNHRDALRAEVTLLRAGYPASSTEPKNGPDIIDIPDDDDESAPLPPTSSAPTPPPHSPAISAASSASAAPTNSPPIQIPSLLPSLLARPSIPVLPPRVSSISPVPPRTQPTPPSVPAPAPRLAVASTPPSGLSSDRARPPTPASQTQAATAPAQAQQPAPSSAPSASAAPIVVNDPAGSVAMFNAIVQALGPPPMSILIPQAQRPPTPTTVTGQPLPPALSFGTPSALLSPSQPSLKRKRSSSEPGEVPEKRTVPKVTTDVDVVEEIETSGPAETVEDPLSNGNANATRAVNVEVAATEAAAQRSTPRAATGVLPGTRAPNQPPSLQPQPPHLSHRAPPPQAQPQTRVVAPDINTSADPKPKADGTTPAPPAPKHPPRLGIRHLPLLYETRGERMSCRFCSRTYPVAAMWSELAGHAQDAHPTTCVDLLALRPAQVLDKNHRLLLEKQVGSVGRVARRQDSTSTSS